ncbi:hypothetical protein LJC54_00185 [Parabacteroides sp. OttesenSCG-928-J18]|nr:hypothetical protein [Parabacteroides sp. OttesenSCG-928-J18]
MNKVEVEINSDQIIELFNSLDSKKQTTVYKRTMKKASAILVNQTRKNIRNVLPNSKKKNKWGMSFEDGVKSNIWRDGSTAKVNIMRHYMLKWFEKGTQERHTGNRILKRKPHPTGRIKANWFFKKAKEQTEKRIFQEIDSELAKNIVKVWGKANKPAMRSIFQ